MTMQRLRKNAWKSAAAERIRFLADYPPTVEDAVVIIAERLLSGIECPPTDLDAIMPRLNVEAHQADDALLVSGELRQGEHGLVIAYSPHQPQSRIRFTIAHEMGHAILEASGPRCPRRGRELERLCDMLATELLLPRRIFASCAGKDPTAETVIRLARQFHTSLAATARRCTELYAYCAFEIEDAQLRWSFGIPEIRKLLNSHPQLKNALHVAREGHSGIVETSLRQRNVWVRYQIEWQPVHAGPARRAIFLMKALGPG